MTTSLLISYIKKQIQNNVSEDLIISKLISVGWHKEDIDEGFSSVDKYSEPLAEKSIAENNIIDVKKELPKMEVFNIEPPKIEIPKVTIPIIEPPKIEIPKVTIPIIETPKIEIPKVWVPIRVPVKEVAIVVESLELPPLRGAIETIEKPEPVKIDPPQKIESINKIPFIINPKYFNKKEELIPTLTPKAPAVPSLIKNLPKIPMLSSYQSDLLSVSKIKKEIIKKKSHKIIKWSIFAFVICVLAFFIWAFASGYIKNINIPFIKKDPKVLLLNNSKVLAGLQSYKTETSVEISSPSFANITYGLVSGEALSSRDKDSFSINTIGMINQNAQGLLSDNFVTIKGSLLPNYITTDIKNDGSDLFISVPDLSQIINENAPPSQVVKINEQQFNLISPLFSSNLESYLNKINIYKILSSGMSSYINNETLSAYDELINNVEIIEKGQENIKGIDTYHYGIISDRQLAKNLLSKISDNFVLNLSQRDKDNLAQILGAVTIDSFDVWVGKGDNNIYQYNVVLDIPLSKIIGFEDKSIGDNKININWKTTYYDFNIANNISMPDTFTPATDFVNVIKETKIKNDVSSFNQLATGLFNAEGAYGSKSNALGSCMNPTSGSLFSPTLHTKKAITAVSSISLLLNKILGITNNAGFCYSTPKTWSFSIPISINYDLSMVPATGYQHFFCIDSTGASADLIAPQTGVVCLP